jgi:hypothetical protein
MTPDPTLIEQAVELLARLEEIDGNKAGAFTLRSVGVVGTVFEQKLSAVLATLQVSAALPSEAIADALETARQRAVVLFQAYARGVQSKDGRTEEQFIHDVNTFNDELTDALRFPISMRATTPTAPIEGLGASVPDQALDFDGECHLTETEARRITSRLSPTPETGLVEALAEARSALFYIFECSEDEQVSSVAKETFDKADAALSNVLPDEV